MSLKERFLSVFTPKRDHEEEAPWPPEHELDLPEDEPESIYVSPEGHLLISHEVVELAASMLAERMAPVFAKSFTAAADARLEGERLAAQLEAVIAQSQRENLKAAA